MEEEDERNGVKETTNNERWSLLCMQQRMRDRRRWWRGPATILNWDYPLSSDSSHPVSTTIVLTLSLSLSYCRCRLGQLQGPWRNRNIKTGSSFIALFPGLKNKRVKKKKLPKYKSAERESEWKTSREKHHHAAELLKRWIEPFKTYLQHDVRSLHSQSRVRAEGETFSNEKRERNDR